jgi:hypothetical protein
LEKIVPEHGEMEDYEVKHEFPGAGHRTMRLNPREVFFEGGANPAILLGMQDVTRQSALERENKELLREKDLLLEEMQHRVLNSLQIIASINSDESADGEIGRDAPSSAGHSFPGRVDCGFAGTSSCTGDWRVDRPSALSHKAVRSRRHLDDRRHPANLSEGVR